MNRAYKYITCTVACLLFALSSGCSPTPQPQATEKATTVVEENAEFLINEANLDENVARDTAEVLESVGASKILVVTEIPDSAGKTVRITTENGNVYYLGYGASEHLEIIRADTSYGEILYAPEE